MTRKKSNVKALVLAVTCAILAGGYSGLNPVYAAPEPGIIPTTGDVTYDRISTELKYGDATSSTDIRELTVGGVTIDGTGNSGSISANEIVAKKIVGSAGSNPSAISINGATFANGGAITATGLTLADNYNVKTNIEGAKDRITAVENNLTTNQNNLSTLEGRVNGHDTDISSLQTTVGDASSGLVKEVDGLKAKTTKFNNDGTTLTGMEEVGANKVSATKLAVGGKEITADTVAGYDAAVSKTTNITYDAATKTTYINEGTAQQVVIDEKGLKVGKNTSRMNDITGFATSKNLYVGTTDADNPTAANSKFAVDGATGNTAVGGTLDVAGETTFANGIKTDTIVEKTANAGVTVNGNKITTENKFNDVELKNGNVNATDITANGALKGASLNVTNNATVGGTLGVAGATTLGSTLEVTSDTTLHGALNAKGKATFGNAPGALTEIDGDKLKTGVIETNLTQESNIGGVKMSNGKITASNMEITGAISLNDLTVNNKLTVGAFSVDKTGAVTDLQSINGVAVAKSGTGLTIGSATIGDTNPFSSTGFTVDNVGNVKAVKVTAGTITDGNGFTATGGNVTATGTVQGNTISDGAGATLTSGKITAQEGKIGNVTISAAGEVTGVKSIEASTFKVDEDNYLDGNGITATGGHIGGAVINETTLNIGDTTLDKANGITTNKLTIGDMALTGTGLNTGTNDFQVNGVTFNQGKVTAQADKGFVAGTSSFKEGSLIVDANNKLEATNGLTTEKATVKGNLDVTGQATFGTVDNQTTINGKTVTTDTLKANRLILGTSGDATVEVDKDGSLIAAKGKFKVDKDGALKAANGAFNVDKDGKTTFTKDADNLSSINGGNIWAKATDAANHTSSELQHDSTGLHVSGTHAGKTSAFAFDAATGISTFTGQDNSTVTINGSAIRSAKSDGTAGRLDGENLTLYKDANNQTTMSAGKATFKSDNAGKYNGKETTIDGGVITTDTLNVQRINLGKEMVNSDGTTTAVSNLSIDEHGNIKAAGGNFTVAGTDQGNNKGALHNEVGNTSFNTTVDGASMKFDNTAAAGGVTSEVAVEANKATVAAGEKASFVATTDNGGTATITGGTQTVTTTDKGTVFENSAHKTAFVDNGATNTIINGNEITTGKITTDQLVITGKGNADGNGGSIAFGGNGTIKSDINDGTANGKNTSFETTLDGVNTKVTNGTTTTENQVTAAGNSNTVKQDDKHKSEFNQGLTSIGGVVTNGEIKVAQKLDGATGLLTNEVTNADGKWSKLEQSGTGLTYTDSANAGNATRIDSSDVSIGSATEPDKRINLSDLGQIDELDPELTGRDEYKNNSTAVGGINAEAAIRREEVARLDGRINDVNDRVNKVGAMAAAIASLKSIGYDPQAPSEFSIGLGQYKGETGVAMGFFHYPNKNFMINVSLSTAGGETMGGIGATWRFGHKSPQKLLEEQREEQAKKELAAAEKYQAAAKLAKEAQERAEYAAKLARQAQVSADNAKAAADATQAKHFG